MNKIHKRKLINLQNQQKHYNIKLMNQIFNMFQNLKYSLKIKSKKIYKIFKNNNQKKYKLK